MIKRKIILPLLLSDLIAELSRQMSQYINKAQMCMGKQPQRVKAPAETPSSTKMRQTNHSNG